jgi:hypothetical protein
MLDLTMIGTQSDVAHAPVACPPEIWPMRNDVVCRPAFAALTSNCRMIRDGPDRWFK